jgi:hypothetical protein
MGNANAACLGDRVLTTSSDFNPAWEAILTFDATAPFSPSAAAIVRGYPELRFWLFCEGG